MLSFCAAACGAAIAVHQGNALHELLLVYGLSKELSDATWFECMGQVSMHTVDLQNCIYTICAITFHMNLKVARSTVHQGNALHNPCQSMD